MFLIKKNNEIEFNISFNNNYKNTNKILWLPFSDKYKPITLLIKKFKKNDNLVDDIIIEKYIGEPAMCNIKKGEYVQLYKSGYYLCEQCHDSNGILTLIEIP